MSLGFSLLFLSHTLPCWPTLLDLTMVVTHLTSAHSPFFVRVLYQFAAMPFWRTAAGPATCSLLVYPLRRIAPVGPPNAYDSQIATSFFFMLWKLLRYELAQRFYKSPGLCAHNLCSALRRLRCSLRSLKNFALLSAWSRPPTTRNIISALKTRCWTASHNAIFPPEDVGTHGS